MTKKFQGKKQTDRGRKNQAKRQRRLAKRQEKRRGFKSMRTMRRAIARGQFK